MDNNISLNHHLSEDYLRKKKRRTRWIIFGLLSLLIVLTAVEIYIQQSHISTPLAGNIAVLLLVNVNIILLAILILMVAKNLVKLYLDRKWKIIGARFRTKLVLSFAVITFVPSLLLFLVASGLLTNSINNWFNQQIEKSLKESLEVAEGYYAGSGKNILTFANVLNETFSGKNMMAKEGISSLKNTVLQKRVDYKVDGILVFDRNLSLIAESIETALKSRIMTANSNQLPALLERALNGEEAAEILSLDNKKLVAGISPIKGSRQPAAGNQEIAGVTVVLWFASADMVGKIGSIVNALEEYKQLKLLKNPIKLSYEITLLLITLLILFSAVWFGFYMAKGITVPIKELAEATKSVAEGNLDFKVNVKANDEIGMLVESFNQMTSDLKDGKMAIERANEEMRKTNIELERRKGYMETVLENIATGVISIDSHGRVSTINHAASKILNINPDEIKGESYKNAFDASYLNPVRAMIKGMSEAERENTKGQIQIMVGGRVLTLTVSITVLRDGNWKYLGMVIVFDDLTELIKAQKTAAWREVARGIAHEIKNPLTPIQLNTQRLKKKFKEGSPDFKTVFDEGTNVIIQEVEGLKKLVDEFSKFARMPEPNPRPYKLHRIIDDALTLYRNTRKGIKFITSYDSGIDTINVDHEQFKRVFINLIENSIDAVNGNGVIEINTSLDRNGRTVRIEVADNGIGIPDKNKDKLFLPYFSTKKKGSGLGLAIVNRIVADHDGVIRVEDNLQGGARFVIELPV
ncbi:MAG: HAMP domain-containing protein [Nitrospinae bacterium]|nr:HAMP domain-containing protein [Nitrospinota bacterium]